MEDLYGTLSRSFDRCRITSKKDQRQSSPGRFSRVAAGLLMYSCVEGAIYAILSGNVERRHYQVHGMN